MVSGMFCNGNLENLGWFDNVVGWGYCWVCCWWLDWEW